MFIKAFTIILCVGVLFVPSVLLAQFLPSTSPLLPPPEGHKYESQDFFNSPPETRSAEIIIPEEKQPETQSNSVMAFKEEKNIFKPWLVILVLIGGFGLVWKYASDKTN